MKKISMDKVVEAYAIEQELSKKLSENLREIMEDEETIKLNILDKGNLYQEITKDEDGTISYWEEYEEDGLIYEAEHDYDDAPLSTKLVIYSYIIHMKNDE